MAENGVRRFFTLPPRGWTRRAFKFIRLPGIKRNVFDDGGFWPVPPLAPAILFWPLITFDAFYDRADVTRRRHCLFPAIQIWSSRISLPTGTFNAPDVNRANCGRREMVSVFEKAGRRFQYCTFVFAPKQRAIVNISKIFIPLTTVLCASIV